MFSHHTTLSRIAKLSIVHYRNTYTTTRVYWIRYLKEGHFWLIFTLSLHVTHCNDMQQDASLLTASGPIFLLTAQDIACSFCKLLSDNKIILEQKLNLLIQLLVVLVFTQVVFGKFHWRLSDSWSSQYFSTALHILVDFSDAFTEEVSFLLIIIVNLKTGFKQVEISPTMFLIILFECLHFKIRFLRYWPIVCNTL